MINPDKKTKYLIRGIGLLLLLVLIFLGFWFNKKSGAGEAEGLKLTVSKDQILDYQIIQSGNQPAGGVVKYHYVSNQEVPPMFYRGLKEDISKRTSNSLTFLESVTPINDKLQKEKYISRFYSGPTFQKSGNKWYQVETATTTAVSFYRQTKLTVLDHVKEFFGRPVMADTIYSGAGDGSAEKSNSDVWATTHDATTGETVSNDPETTANARSILSILTGNYGIDRAFLPFDTSAIPSDATITNATLTVYTTAADDGLNDTYDYLNVVQTFQASSATLVVGDYQDNGSDNGTEARAKYTPIQVGADPLDLTGFVTGTASSTFTLTSTGRGWIKRNGEAQTCGSTAGVTCLGIRQGNDIANITNDSNVMTGITFSTSAETGTAQDPYLAVTYTVATPSKVVIDGSTIKIDGGTLKID